MPSRFYSFTPAPRTTTRRGRQRNRRSEPRSAAIALCALLSGGLIASQVAPALAGDNSHRAYLASVSTYKPMAGFVHVVGPTRFVGYFLATSHVCRVSVFTAAADDEVLATPPKRIDIDVKAADRAELPAGDGSALAIACTADADLIKIAPQKRAVSASTP